MIKLIVLDENDNIRFAINTCDITMLLICIMLINVLVVFIK